MTFLWSQTQANISLSSSTRYQELLSKSWDEVWSGPILESKDMHATFQKKGKKGKKGKIFENLGKNMHNLKIFWKRAGDCVRLLYPLNC